LGAGLVEEIREAVAGGVVNPGPVGEISERDGRRPVEWVDRRRRAGAKAIGWGERVV
jgi:hypothetical protein